MSNYICCFVLGGSTCPCLSTSGLRAMSKYNLIVLGNFTSSSDVELNTIICDSLNLPNNVNFGGRLNQQTFAADSYILEVNRGVSATNGITLQVGRLGVGCNPNKTITKSGNQYKVDGSTVLVNDNRNGAGVQAECDLDSRCQNISSGLITLSQQLALLPADSVSNPVQIDQQGKRMQFMVNKTDCNGMAVFNLSADSVFNQQNREIYFNKNTNNVDLVVVNLYGSQVILGSSVNMPSSWLTTEEGKSKVIWNLYQATDLQLNAVVNGALLGPYAVISNAGNHVINGVTVLKNFITQSEIHHPYITFPPGLARCE